MTKTTFFLLGVCIGAAAPLIAKTLRPLSTFAFAGGMVAYEAACDAAEASRDAISTSLRRIKTKMKS